MRLSLNGKWDFVQVGQNIVMPATVPGCNYTDLLDNNKIEDPFYGLNEKKTSWIGESDWLYSREFEITNEQLDNDIVNIVFEKLDTIAAVSVNGVNVLNSINYHLKYEKNIKDELVCGINKIEVYFYSPVKYVLKKQEKEKCPNNCNGLTGIAHLRKPQCHFGWDWGPVLTPSGISGDVYLEFRNYAKISEIDIKQQLSNASVKLCISTKMLKYKDFDFNFETEIIDPNGKTISIIKSDKPTNEITIKEPQLWQTYEWTQKKQPLYLVKVSILRNDEIVDSITKRIGIRTIELNRQEDKYGNNFQFVLNGNPIFAKGADWIPADSFPVRVTKEIVEKYIKTAINSGFNMLRVWGGGYYETEEFYDLCDEYGILVWQDFCFACQAYPFFIDEFRDNVRDEVEYNVKRLRSHPSLCLWCGNNEIEAMQAGWLTRKNYIEWTEKYFYHILPEEVARYDSVTPFISGSPIGTSFNKNVSSDNVGDTHLWAVWHGLQSMKYYRTRNTRFCSEFGFESFPDVKCLEKFAEKKDYSLNSEVFSSHQKCNSGNEKIAYYVGSRFRLPKDFEDYIYLSQICQAECIKDATEYWRRNKGRCNGSMYWQYNDCWPTCSWSSVDYYGNYKALQYTSKNFFKSTEVSIEDDKKQVKVFAINDLLEEKIVTIRCRLISFDGKCYLDDKYDVKIPKNGVLNIHDYIVNDLKKLGNIMETVFVADLIENDTVTNRKTVLFAAEKKLKLPLPKIEISVKKDGGIAKYTLISSQYARLVKVSTKENSPFSDNYFDLLPNEPVEITQETELHEKELEKSIAITTVSNIEPKQSLFKDDIERIKIALIPINIANWVVYKWFM